MSKPGVLAILRRPLAPVAAAVLGLAMLGVVVRGDNVVTQTDADIVTWAARVRTPAIVDIARALTNFGNGTSVAVVLIIAGAVAVRRNVLRPVVAAAPVVSLALGVFTSMAVKVIVGRPRPPVALHEVVERTSGYPSGHSTQAAAGYLALALVLTYATRSPDSTPRRWPIVAALILVAIVGATRVALAVHSPTDVLAGWTLGAVCAVGVVAFCLMASKPGSGSAVGGYPRGGRCHQDL